MSQKKTNKRKPREKMVEIARSFSFKKNLGSYENADFFCSAKKEVKESEMEETSEKLYQFCRSEVIKSVNRYTTKEEGALALPQGQLIDHKKSRDVGRDSAELDVLGG